MSRVTVYIAASVDGYIARKDGSVDWLPPVEEGEDYGYDEFYASVDTLVMGRRTYEQILTFGDWPYPGKPVFVLSRSRTGQADSGVAFVDALPADMGHTWLVGAQAIQAYAEAGRIDEWIISLVPVLLGRGIPLFLPTTAQTTLALQGCRAYPGGLATVHYRNGG